MRKGVLGNFTKFTRKHLCKSLRPATLLKRDSGTGVFLWILGNFSEHLFYRTPLCDCFWICHWDTDFHNQPFTDVFQNRCSSKFAGLLLQSTYGGFFWIFAAANNFLQLNMVIIDDSHINFCSGPLWKQGLNLRSSHWSCSVKKVYF